MAWAFLTRAGGEQDLIDELGGAANPRRIGDGVVLADQRPRARDGALRELAFARQAMRAEREAAADPDAVREALSGLLTRRRGSRVSSWSLQVVAPDSADPHDPRRAVVRRLLEGGLEEALHAALPAPVAAARTTSEDAERLLQAWPIDADDLLLGLTEGSLVLSRAPGGRARLKRAEDAPSRAGSKLEEAIAWIGVGPERGDRIVDLGAAPGGWSKVAHDRGASVIAIDPARMKVDLPGKRFRHLAQSAFDYAPEETLDWLLCDMAWRPFEVAKLIAKWGRRAWARQIFVNFKLPMKRKAQTLAKIRTELERAGWKGVRARQLYYDRDEVTVYAWLDPGLAVRGALPAFEMRSRSRNRGAKPRAAGGGPRKGPRRKRPTTTKRRG